MWTLIVFAATTGSSGLHPSLASCEQQFEAQAIEQVERAYCLSATGDRVYLVLDGKRFRFPSSDAQ